MSDVRVVVTGLGVVSPLGQSVAEFWRRLIAGERGLGQLTKFDPTGLRNALAGQVWDWQFDPAAFGLETAPDEATQFLLVAAREALASAGLSESGSPRPELGAVLSTNFGGALSWEDFCRQVLAAEADPATFAHTFEEFLFHQSLSHVSRAFGLGGPVSLLSIACASGAAAVGLAYDLLAAGEAEVMLAGGHDSLAPSPLSGLSVLHTMAAEDIRPFSADRGGTLFGEGAAMLVLETLDHAQARGATALAEVLGSWQNNNAYHLTAPDPGGAGMARVLRETLREANVAPEQVDYVNAHGTGTEHHDPAETEALKAVLGAHAYEIPVSSIKGATAHLMGAAGALETVATVKTLQTGVVPPTVNYREPDPACDLDYVPNVAREARVDCAATLSAGVGGSNACVVLGRGDAPQSRVLSERAARVLITGLAPIAAVGIGREDFTEGLAEGREGCRPPERLAEAAGALPLLAECLDFVVDDYLESKKTYLDRCSALTLAACHLAFADAGLDWRALDHERLGLSVGTACGCLDSMLNMTARVQAKGVRFGSPVIFTHSFANSPVSLAAIEYQIQGPACTFCTGDLSAASALAYGAQLIRSGRADIVLAGGVDALSVPLVRYLAATQPAFVPGEGAGLMVLESEAHAVARGAIVRGELLGVSVAASPADEVRARLAARCGVEAQAFTAPASYGRTFGAAAGLDAIAALVMEPRGPAPEDGAPRSLRGETHAVSVADPTGPAACLLLRSGS